MVLVEQNREAWDVQEILEPKCSCKAYCSKAKPGGSTQRVAHTSFGWNLKHWIQDEDDRRTLHCAASSKTLTDCMFDC